ncbi:MAG: 1-acyl-sn-glycerol-3-phosphate acyltransferase [Sandaracinaceae bacterium]
MSTLFHHPAAPLLRRSIHRLGRSMLRAGYRFRVRGVENVPRGPALLLSNHVGFIDFWLVAAAMPETPRFVMHEAHFETPGFASFFELHGVIPIATRREDPRRLVRAVREVERALGDGQQVMLFPEGTMTPDGELSPIRPGFRRILRRQPVPVVPIALRGVWGSWFSRRGGPPMKKRPRRFRAPVEVVFGPPLEPGALDEATLAAKLLGLRGERR